MTSHYKIRVATGVIVGHDGVPTALQGLPDEVLADPAAYIFPCPPEFAGFGWWPLLARTPVYDPETQRLSDQLDETPDPVTRTVRVTPLVVNLTPTELTIRAEVQATLIETARVVAIAANNAAAGRAREAYLTPGTGQETTYAAKQAEVARWVAAGRPAAATADAYPWAGDRAQLRAVTVAEVLAEWEAVTAAWELVGRQIETERERVNLAIEQAGALEAIKAAQDSAVYPTPDPP